MSIGVRLNELKPLNSFTPRIYQVPFFEAMESGKYRHAIFIGPRRLGKDFMCWNFAIRWAFRRTTSVLYLLPTYSQCKAVIWDAIANDGTKFLDLIPKDKIVTMNGSEMKIVLDNGSQIQLRGADNFDRSIVGSNASLIIFSEYAMCDERAYEYASPIVAANGGSMVFLSTPRGRNHLFRLWNQSEKWKDWFRYKLTLNDTKHISDEELAKEREKHSEEFVSQEWFCSFDRGIEGSFYAKYITNMKLNGQIGEVPYDPLLPVFTAWDLGYNDQTVILFGQITKNNLVRIIDCYANTNQPLNHYIKITQSKEYVYSKHFAPHDIEVHDYQTGQSRIEMARALGLNFEVREVKGKMCSATPRVSVADGIEKCMASFSRIYIDKDKCSRLITALESYHREWDDDKKVYKQQPYHDSHSDWADSFRYLCLTLDMHAQGMTEEDAHKGYNKTVWGSDAGSLDNPFSDVGHKFPGRFF